MTFSVLHHIDVQQLKVIAAQYNFASTAQVYTYGLFIATALASCVVGQPQMDRMAPGPPAPMSQRPPKMIAFCWA